jgi:hypothetical protein
MKLAVLVFALLLPAVAHSQIYKCNVGGKSVYSNEPCAPTAAQRIAERSAKITAEKQIEDEALAKVKVDKAGADNASVSDKYFEGCREKLIRAQKLQVLYDMSWKLPAEPRIVAGPTFFQMPIDAKEGFAETVNCFLMAGQKEKFINFDVHDWRTGKPVGRFSFGKFKMN